MSGKYVLSEIIRFQAYYPPVGIYPAFASLTVDTMSESTELDTDD